MRGQVFKQGRKRLICCDHGITVAAQRAVDRAFGLRDAQHATHALQVRGSHVIDERDIRRQHIAQIRDVTWLARAHFIDTKSRVLWLPQHSQGQTDFIVQIARIGITQCNARQNALQESLDRCFFRCCR
jgi:hypothetical protein